MVGNVLGYRTWVWEVYAVSGQRSPGSQVRMHETVSWPDCRGFFDCWSPRGAKVLGAPAHEEENKEHRDGYAQEPEENPACLALLLTLPKGLEFCFHIPESGVPASGMDQM